MARYVVEGGNPPWTRRSTSPASMRAGLTAVESMPAPGGGAVLTFGTHGVDATRAELGTRGDVRFDGENCSIDGWVRLATLYDPDGNVLMLYQDLSKD